jgi:predicted dehydrogenase
MSYTVNFERATADYDSARGPEALRLFEPERPARTVECPGPDGYVCELRHMIEATQSGKPPSVVTIRDAVSAVEICEAEEKSARLKREVAVE